ncbi:MAG: hypothetical protein GY928_20610 [Colwellia sp.]|nr:hypothetical protein [Colwellia sp.]
MATTTARDIIRLAMLEIGILAAGETPSAEDSNDAFDKLNLVIDSWAGNNLMQSAAIEETANISAGTNNYAIGSNQTIDTSKPFDIISAFLRDSNSYDYGLKIIDKKEYDSKSDKTLQNKPDSLYYNPGASQQANQTGTLYFYPTPKSAYTLHLTSMKPFTAFSDLNSNVTFPAGYKKALIEDLAINLAPMYKIPVSRELYVNAEKSLAVVQNINARNTTKSIRLDLPGSNRNYYNDFHEGY